MWHYNIRDGRVPQWLRRPSLKQRIRVQALCVGKQPPCWCSLSRTEPLPALGSLLLNDRDLWPPCGIRQEKSGFYWKNGMWKKSVYHVILCVVWWMKFLVLAKFLQNFQTNNGQRGIIIYSLKSDWSGVFLVSHANSCSDRSVSWFGQTIIWVQTEMSQQLLDELPFNFAKTFLVPRGCIWIILVIWFGDLTLPPAPAWDSNFYF